MNVEEHHCPDCGGILRKKSGSKGHFWSCSKYPECTFACDDLNDSPLQLPCPDCGKLLRAGSNSVGLYTVCFAKENHADGQMHFFGIDGKPQEMPQLPKAKGAFSCPECKAELKYFRIKSGKNAGKMCFGCFESGNHSDDKPLFFNDNDGAPDIP